MNGFLGEGFNKVIAGVALASVLILVFVMFIAPSKATGVPEVFQQMVSALSR